MRKVHPHTSAVHGAARTIDRVVQHMREGPQFMGSPQQLRDRTIAAAAPDVKAWTGRLPIEMVHTLAKMDRKE